MTTITKDQIKAAIQTLLAVAEAIRELKQVPSGTLYAQLCGIVDFESYEKIIGTLKKTGLIRETESHLLQWTGPTISEEKAQNSLLA